VCILGDAVVKAEIKDPFGLLLKVAEEPKLPLYEGVALASAVLDSP
jgi:hypothetical protein